MSDAIESQGAKLEIGTGSGGADSITAITEAGIMQVTSAGHGNSAGDVGAFASVGGMTELNGQTLMIIATETDEMFFDVDSTGYTTYTSGGTFTPVTYTEVSEVTDWDGPGGAAAVIDVSHLQSTAKEKMMGLMDEGQLTLTVNWIPSDTGQLALQTARAARTLKNFRLTYSDGTIQTFSAYVLNFSTAVSVDDRVVGSITLEISGLVTTT